MTTFCTGDRVEVVDPSHRHCGETGTVAYLVGDNIYVHFAHVRWMATKVLFAEQLRLSVAPQGVRARPAAAEIPRVEPAT